MSSKKKRLNDESRNGSEATPDPLKKRTFPGTPKELPPYKSVIKSSTIKKSTLDSVKKGHAELCYSADTGLIYTSPNTMEMKPIVENKENSSIASVALKLSFDPAHEKSSSEQED